MKIGSKLGDRHAAANWKTGSDWGRIDGRRDQANSGVGKYDPQRQFFLNFSIAVSRKIIME